MVSICHSPDGVNQYAMEFQGQLVKASVKSPLPVFSSSSSSSKSPSRRGVILGLSRKSRKRLLEWVMRLQRPSSAAPVIFLTLTYGQVWPTEREGKRHLRLFLKRLYRLFPRSSFIWKMEYQDRGAPHFHLVCFNLPYVPAVAIKQMWGAVIELEYWDLSGDEPEEPFTRVEALQSWRRLVSYVSKYIAKSADLAARFQSSPSPDEDGGFNNVPYLAVRENPGRFWGVFNRAAMPLAELKTIVISGGWSDKAYADFRRGAAKVWARAQSGRVVGFTLFVDNPGRWLEFFEYCALA